MVLRRYKSKAKFLSSCHVRLFSKPFTMQEMRHIGDHPNGSYKYDRYCSIECQFRSQHVY